MIAFGMPFQLLRDYQGQDVSVFLMSEKFDGWRLGWNGSDFILRGGGIFNVPPSWKVGMPTTALDGELWGGNGSLYELQGRIARGFHGLQFMVFDAPSQLPFRQRLKFLQTLSLPSHAVLVRHERCRDTAHLIEFANAIVDAGGEGAVVRNPRAPYVAGRSNDVLRWVPVPPERNRRRVA
jgi:DNA ligase-1